MDSMNFLGYVIIMIFILYLFTRIKKGPFIFLTADKHIVFIKDFEFIPNKLEINVGDTVFWINKDQVRHTVISDNDFIPNSDIILYNEDFQHTFNNTGNYMFGSSLYDKVKSMEIIVNEKKELKDEMFFNTIISNLSIIFQFLLKKPFVFIYDIITLNY